MALVGHKTESVYRRYAITDAAMLREGIPIEGALRQLCADLRRGALR